MKLKDVKPGMLFSFKDDPEKIYLLTDLFNYLDVTTGEEDLIYYTRLDRPVNRVYGKIMIEIDSIEG